MNEEKLAALQTEQMVETYYNNKKYRPYLQAFEKSLVSKAMDITEHHLIQLGKQFDQWETYQQLCEATGSLQNLGELPKIGLSVISASFSNSVLPVIASTQAIEDQKSIIWFKNLRADDTKGNRTAGQKIVDPRTGSVSASAYASNFAENEIGVGATTALQVAYSFVVASIPVYRETMKVSTSLAGIYGEDVGPKGVDENVGTILGAGISGTINYLTGQVDVTFAADPLNGETVSVDYQQNLEEAEDLPRISSFLDQTSVQAKAYALKSVIGMFQQFALKKRFGDSALDEMTMDLTREINNEISADLIRGYLANAVGTTNFSLAIPTNISEKQHRESYSFRLADAEQVMLSNAGRGAIKVLIAGSEKCALLSGLDGFKLLSDGNSLGTHIYGTYKGRTVIRVPDASLMPAKSGIGLYTGANPLESAGVYCPFMPLTVTQLSPEKPNPLMDQKAAATMAATKVVVPQYATNFNIIA